MKTLILVILLFVAIPVMAQTSLSFGEGNFYSFKENEPSQFKIAALSQVNQSFGRFTLSALVVGYADSTARALGGTGFAYEISQSKDKEQSIYLGVNALKGEGKEAYLGASGSVRIANTLISLVYENSVADKTHWLGLTLQQIVLKTK